MKLRIILGIMIIASANCGCDFKKNKPSSFNEMCKTVIDNSLSFDTALNQGDSLYFDFPKDLSLNNNDEIDIINYVHVKYKFNVGLSSLDNLIKWDSLYEKKGYLKNFFISVIEVKFLNSKKISIKSQKFKGKFGAIVVETIFEFRDHRWIYKSSKIISAS
jgi:hypothetical protein